MSEQEQRDAIRRHAEAMGYEVQEPDGRSPGEKFAEAVAAGDATVITDCEFCGESIIEDQPFGFWVAVIGDDTAGQDHGRYCEDAPDHLHAPALA